jgi:hypothetical protein
MMALLRDELAGRKRVYVLIGNEPIAACYERAEGHPVWRSAMRAIRTPAQLAGRSPSTQDAV